MDLSKILSIAGKSGLFKLIGEAKNNIVVESIVDGKKQPAFAHERISSLHEISIYTETGDISLKEVLKNLFKLQEAKPIERVKKMSSNDIKALFEKVVPDYDKDAVYVSDMKKVFVWYNILLEHNLLDFSDDDEKKENTKTEDDNNNETSTEITDEKTE